MKSVLEDYSFRYFNTMRPHQRLGQRIPVSTGARASTSGQPLHPPAVTNVHLLVRAGSATASGRTASAGSSLTASIPGRPSFIEDVVDDLRCV